MVKLNKERTNILYLGEGKASYYLFFAGASANKNINFIDIKNKKKKYFNAHEIELIKKANHIIFSREINYRTIKISGILNKYNIPYSYFADDNYFLLRRILPNKSTNKFLNNTDHIISGSINLMKYFKLLNNKIDDSFINLTMDINLKKQRKEANILSGKTISIGFFGTAKDKLYEQVFSDLESNLKEFQLKIILPKKLAKTLKKRKKSNSVEFFEIEFTENYHDFIDKIILLKIDFLIHPADKEDKNFKYKNFNSILLPYHCKCLTLFCNNRPWSKLKNSNLCELINDDNNFSKKIITLFENPEKYNYLCGELKKYVIKKFSTSNNLFLLEKSLNFKTKNENENGLVSDLQKLKFNFFEREIFFLKRSLYRKKIKLQKKTDFYEQIDERI